MAIRLLLKRVLDWFEKSVGSGSGGYDLGYVAELGGYRHMEVLSIDDGQTVRCNICGRIFEDVNATFEHVASHNDLKGADIDPFEWVETSSYDPDPPISATSPAKRELFENADKQNSSRASRFRASSNSSFDKGDSRGSS